MDAVEQETIMGRFVQSAVAPLAAIMLTACCPVHDAHIPYFEVTPEMAEGYEDSGELIPHLLVAAETVNLHKGPGDHYEIVAQLRRGERYHLFAYGDVGSGWYFLDHGAGFGYVDAGLVTVCNSHPVHVTAVPFRVGE